MTESPKAGLPAEKMSNNNKNKTIMEKWEKAVSLLNKTTEEYEFQDDVYTMVDNIIKNSITDIEKKLGMYKDALEDGVAWYDEVMDDMRHVLYDRIGEWLNENKEVKG